MIGAIADDFTGATDAAAAFRGAGLSTAILFGISDEQPPVPETDVVVIGLKTRTAAPDEAVRQSLAALHRLQSLGAHRFFFKYCSTFDSRPEGNIGCVADALADELDAGPVVMVPSSPGHERTQYLGHLFVGPALLAESPMRHHPLTPMTDSRVPLLLQAQTKRPVALIPLPIVRSGPAAIRASLAAGARNGYAVVDAIDDRDLELIGEAVKDDILVAGAAGLATGLGTAHSRARLFTADHPPDPVGTVRTAVLAGSCSAQTLQQIAHLMRTHSAHRLDAVATPDAGDLADAALLWADQLPAGTAPLIYSSLPPEELRAVQAAIGSERASRILESAMGLIAHGLIERGVRRLVIAGGETSGAVVSALDVRGGLVGAEIAPGVPWIYTLAEPPIALLLKSGNFGRPEILADAVGTGTAESSTR